MTADFPVVLDACVLVPASLRDTLLRCESCVCPNYSNGNLSANVLCGLFDQRRNLLRVRDVDCMAGSGDLDLVAPGPCGIPTFEIGVDRSVASGYQHPAWFAPPCRRGDHSFEVLGPVQYLRSSHES